MISKAEQSGPALSVRALKRSVALTGQLAG